MQIILPSRRAASGKHSRKHERELTPGHETHHATGPCRPGSSPHLVNQLQFAIKRPLTVIAAPAGLF